MTLKDFHLPTRLNLYFVVDELLLPPEVELTPWNVRIRFSTPPSRITSAMLHCKPSTVDSLARIRRLLIMFHFFLFFLSCMFTSVWAWHLILGFTWLLFYNRKLLLLAYFGCFSYFFIILFFVCLGKKKKEGMAKGQRLITKTQPKHSSDLRIVWVK